MQAAYQLTRSTICHDDTVLYVNPAGVKLWGAEDSAALLGSSVLDLVQPEYREVVRER